MSQSTAQGKKLPPDVEATLQHIELLIAKQARLADAQSDATDVLMDLVRRHPWSADQAQYLRDRLAANNVKHRGPILQMTGWSNTRLSKVQELRLAQKQPRNAMVGKGVEVVYVLIEDGQVVYIGISAHVRERFKQHRRNGNTFDEWEIYPCESRKAARDLEAVLIQQHRPPRNRRVESRVVA